MLILNTFLFMLLFAIIRGPLVNLATNVLNFNLPEMDWNVTIGYNPGRDHLTLQINEKEFEELRYAQKVKRKEYRVYRCGIRNDFDCAIM